MAYRKVGYLEQIWYIIKYKFRRKKKKQHHVYKALVSDGEKWIHAKFDIIKSKYYPHIPSNSGKTIREVSLCPGNIPAK